jgi:hypothetical protein
MAKHCPTCGTTDITIQATCENGHVTTVGNLLDVTFNNSSLAGGILADIFEALAADEVPTGLIAKLEDVNRAACRSGRVETLEATIRDLSAKLEAAKATAPQTPEANNKNIDELVAVAADWERRYRNLWAQVDKLINSGQPEVLKAINAALTTAATTKPMTTMATMDAYYKRQAEELGMKLQEATDRNDKLRRTIQELDSKVQEVMQVYPDSGPLRDLDKVLHPDRKDE